jgi:hypothetical protein
MVLNIFQKTCCGGGGGGDDGNGDDDDDGENKTYVLLSKKTLFHIHNVDNKSKDDNTTSWVKTG